MSKLPTHCPPLDQVLGGGIEKGAITLVYGEAGTGKTNLALQLARNAVLDDQGKVAYVDTEGVSLERLQQISGKNTARILKGILFYSPHDLEEQVQMIRALHKIKNPSLVVVDSLNMYYRLGLGENGAGATPTLTRMLGDLHHLARVREVPVLATAQVYSDEGVARPFGGKTMEHIVKTMIRFEWLAPGRRRAHLVKHRSQPEGGTTEFAITSDGLATA